VVRAAKCSLRRSSSHASTATSTASPTRFRAPRPLPGQCGGQRCRDHRNPAELLQSRWELTRGTPADPVTPRQLVGVLQRALEHGVELLYLYPQLTPVRACCCPAACQRSHQSSSHRRVSCRFQPCRAGPSRASPVYHLDHLRIHLFPDPLRQGAKGLLDQVPHLLVAHLEHAERLLHGVQELGLRQWQPAAQAGAWHAP
jgi:hypothetical protein